MTRVNGCGSDRERHAFPTACGCQCVWPECLTEYEKVSMRRTAEAQLDARRVRWADEENAA